MEKIPSAFSIHPGDILKTEFMDPLGLSSYRLAKELHVSALRVNDLVRGKRSITADIAIRLSRYLGTTVHLWLGLQMDHDIWVAEKNKSFVRIKPRAQAA